MTRKRKTLPKEIDELLETGDIETLKQVFSRCEPNALRYSKYGSNIFSRTPLPREFAIWAKEQGADVNFKDYNGNTPIYYQITRYRGDEQLLIDLGADIHVTSYDGDTLLHKAAMFGRPQTVKTLLAAGLDIYINAKASSFNSYSTPLEAALIHFHRSPYSISLEVCQILLEHGAEITENARKQVRKIGENFERIKHGITEQDFLISQTESLSRLYEIFDVEPAKEIIIHDGISPIIIEETTFASRFNKLWDYLVPPSGQAKTAQGEALRIAGRIEDELSRNGGANWDNDYRNMLKIFPNYLILGNPLSEQDITEAKHLSIFLRSGNCTREGRRLCELAVKWILQNPKVLEPLEANYNR